MMVTKEHWGGALTSLQQCSPHSLTVSGAAGQGEKHQVLDPVRVTLNTGHTRNTTHPLIEDGLWFFLGFLIPNLGMWGALHWISVLQTHACIELNPNFGPSLADLLCLLACL